MVDCINAVKHGNGRDWWLIFRKNDYPGSNNIWYTYLITSNGIQNFLSQSIGVQNRTGGGHTTFSRQGNKIAFTNWTDVVELYDFDRCTGILSNPITIENDPGMSPYLYTWSCEFSGDASKLYVSTSLDTSYLFQYDLNAPNIANSKDTLWTTNFPLYTGGALKLAADNKIYFSNIYYNGLQFPYPYSDSIYNMYNMNLSVINSPDSLGAACDFQPYSFYLGGKRTYLGLPNNPDYDLEPLVGSPCDTIVSINELANVNTNANLYVYYAPEWEKAFINAEKLKGKNYRLRLVDVVGKEVYSESGALNSPYFTRDLNCASFAKGIYLIIFETEKERLVKKFVVE
jgi:hypothetical protein